MKVLAAVAALALVIGGVAVGAQQGDGGRGGVGWGEGNGVDAGGAG
jgi:hypothetical protein